MRRLRARYAVPAGQSPAEKELEMNRRFPVVALAALGLTVFEAQGQAPAPRTPAPTADPYANNPDAGKLQFPLAAPAGKDSGAIRTPLPGGVNQGPFNADTWQYGP